MSVSIGLPSGFLSPKDRGTITADGSEQTIIEYVGGRLSLYIDLSNMGAGDTITVRQYMRVKPTGTYAKYWEEEYKDAQPNPIIYVVPKETFVGIKVTLQQTAGVMRAFDWNAVQGT